MKKTKQTKFPVARIKKIMQTDEDVGKVAMATPVLVSKALELFMASLVGAAADETRAANSKKMTPYHLKRTILNTPMFDFLHEQVAAIPDPVVASSAGGSGRVAPTGGAGKGRKKKAPTPSSSGGSSGETSDEDDDDDDERRRRPSKSGGGSQPHGRAPAKKPKVEISSLKQGAAIPALPTALSVPALPSVFAAPPSYGAGLPPPIFTPGLPSIPGPAAGQNYGGNRAVKREGSESESGSSDEDE